jgi:extracellular elastinolytic metalloproteinase
MKIKAFLITISSFICLSLVAQNYKATGLSLEIIQKIQTEYQLTDRDISEMVLKQKSVSKQNGVTHYYFNQAIQGTEIHNTILNIHVLANGELLHHSSRFIPDAIQKINTKKKRLQADEATAKAFKLLNKPSPTLNILEQNDQQILYKKNEQVLSPIPTWICYWKNEKRDLILAWSIGLEMAEGDHAWSMKIDAQTGELLEKIDLMDHCDFSHSKEKNEHYQHHNHSIKKEQSYIFNPDTYSIFPYNVESPAHGNIMTVVNPAHPTGSPYGWHDQNGIPGAETTITFGNNCRSFQDRDGNLIPSGDEPDGGVNLEFNYPFDPGAEPDQYVDFSVVQAFYQTNILHDISYLYGFDEAHGNFQFINYIPVDGEGDYINVHCQYRGDLEAGLQGETINRNNANFFSGFQDGDKGRLRTYLWTEEAVNAPRLIVNSPETIAGGYFSGTAQFGGLLTPTPVTGVLILTEPLLACTDITNDLSDKIAVIERGSCDFSSKVYRAEQQGAIAVIICNNEDGLIEMVGGDFAALITIPSIIISRGDCEIIKVEIANGVTASLQQANIFGPNELDSSLDNGVIAHEYAHGISKRLTGGKSTTSCLNNQEEMGEGWSDFFALVTSTNASNIGEEPRGIGTYLIREPNDGTGIRSFPYSTDMNINPATYDYIITESIPHGVGMVWNSMLWDLYWAMVDEYGFDEDIYTGTGGNNMCIQLVIDGMKMQPCEPGFIDARDAIFAADVANYGGTNECLIWKVFARRGLGYSASQGSSNNVGDGSEAFDRLPTCVKELKMTKTATPEVEAGDIIQYEINIKSDLDVIQTGIVVTDIIPDGTGLIENSINHSYELSSNNIIFNIGNLNIGERITIQYQLQTDNNLSSELIFKDGFENDANNWNTNDFWRLNNNISYEGNNAIFIEDFSEEKDVSLELNTEILLNQNQPALYFYHFFETDPAADGGVIEISTDNGNTWTDLGNNISRNGYRGIFQNNFLLGNREGYWGYNGDFSATCIDLDDYQNESVKIRFRFVTNTQDGGNGWYLDNVSFLDLYYINTEVCITSNEGANNCTDVPEKGTVVFPKESIPDQINDFNATIYPNPVLSTSGVNVLLQSQHIGNEIQIRLFDLDGKLLNENTFIKENPIQRFTLPFSNHYKNGYYLVQVIDGKSKWTEKILFLN